ncbi:MAG TPA: amidohydrolase family protein [Candidatus Limnocylindrales bacterium]|nr:amidohydrolase family protein [Candidatus Limnocylindrales bacterium]
MRRLVIAGGTVVTRQGALRVDIAVERARITAIAPDLPRDEAEVVDAAGLLVLPGVVDVHTHLRLEDDEHPRRFHQDTLAAARGGTTTVLSFNNPGTGISPTASRSLLRGLDEFRRRTADRSAVDYGLCAVLTGQQDDPIGELPRLIEAGVPTFKAFMVYDFRLPDDALEAALRTAARHGGMLQLHCEAPEIIDPLVDAAIGRHRVAARYHAMTRPAQAEAIATRRAIDMARRAEAPLYIVHLSSAEALDEVADAKSRGEPVHVETCPHYLTLTDALYGDPDESEVIKRVISPPLRSQADVDALWVGVRDGIVDVIASDHVPDRIDTEKSLPAPPFPKISNGAPGIETLLSIVYSEGVAGRRIGLERMVELLSGTPARLFGLPSKGAVEVGRDADLVLLDPAARRTIRQADLSHTSDFTPYEGMPVVGAIRDVLVRGRRIGDAPGRFLERRLI